MKKRVVVISDLHAGHEFGLTPPEYQRSASSKQGKFEAALWEFYTRAVDSLKPIDILLCNGDMIEGKGEHSGGVELLTSDRHRQVKMAADAIRRTSAPVVRIFYGTRAHTGKEEDFEDTLVDSLKDWDVKLQGHGFFRVNGVLIDIKHKTGSSAIPQGRFTSIARDRMWNVMWAAERERQPKADILIRSHVHYYGFAGGPSWLGITTPGLCYNSHYGVRICFGVVDVGLLVFDIEENGEYTWRPVLADFKALKVRPESL